jgi:hypothetical protein
VTTGGGFFLFRDETLNAKEHFERFDPAGRAISREKAPYGQKQFGATLGGPLRRDSTFYFGAFERLDIQANSFVTINDTDQLTLFGQPIGTAADVLRAAGFPVTTGNSPYAVESNQASSRSIGRCGPAMRSTSGSTGRPCSTRTASRGGDRSIAAAAARSRATM